MLLVSVKLFQFRICIILSSFPSNHCGRCLYIILSFFFLFFLPFHNC